MQAQKEGSGVRYSGALGREKCSIRHDKCHTRDLIHDSPRGMLGLAFSPFSWKTGGRQRRCVRQKHKKRTPAVTPEPWS